MTSAGRGRSNGNVSANELQVMTSGVEFDPSKSVWGTRVRGERLNVPRPFRVDKYGEASDGRGGRGCREAESRGDK